MPNGIMYLYACDKMLIVLRSWFSWRGELVLVRNKKQTLNVRLKNLVLIIGQLLINFYFPFLDTF